MPFLSMVRRAALVTRMLTQRFSLSTQKRRYWRLGRKRRLVLLLAWDTRLPPIGFLPVISQTLAMIGVSRLIKPDPLGSCRPVDFREARFISYFQRLTQRLWDLKGGPFRRMTGSRHGR